MNGKTDDCERTARHRLDKGPAPALQRVGPRLAHRLTGIDIVRDLLVGHRHHLHLGDVDQGTDLVSPGDGQAGEHVMHVSLKSTEHRRGFGGMGRFAQNVPLVDDSGVGSNHHRLPIDNCEGLVPGETFHVFTRSFARPSRLIHIGGMNLVDEPQLIQQGGAARGSRGENQPHVSLPNLMTWVGWLSTANSVTGLAGNNTAFAGAPTSKEAERPVAAKAAVDTAATTWVLESP